MSVFIRVVKMADGVYEYTIDCVIRGYHVYKATWVPSIGDILQCEQERGNVEDMFAVAVKRFDGVTVGHIPRRISRICWFFLQQGGSMLCEVSGGRQYSTDLPQGGLEMPCYIHFWHSKRKFIERLEDLVDCNIN